MSDVRVGATDSALQYLFTNSKNNNFQNNLQTKSTFLCDDDDGSTDGELTDTAGKCSTVMTTVVNKGAGKIDKTWTLSYQMSTIFTIFQ